MWQYYMNNSEEGTHICIYLFMILEINDETKNIFEIYSEIPISWIFRNGFSNIKEEVSLNRRYVKIIFNYYF
jgi:hypothetical protein